MGILNKDIFLNIIFLIKIVSNLQILNDTSELLEKKFSSLYEF